MNFVATIKPSSRFSKVAEKLDNLLNLGIAHFRINFSRGSIKDNLELIQYCKDKYKNQCGIFIDLPGKKIRMLKFEDGAVLLSQGQEFKFDTDTTNLGNRWRVAINDSQWLKNVQIDDTLVLSSGDIKFKVIDTLDSEVVCYTLNSGRVYNLCGIAINERYIENHEMSNLDREILKKVDGLVDFVCPSFVDTGGLINQVRDVLSAHHNVIAKIESPFGIQNLSEIAKNSEGIMLCRGDLSICYDQQIINDDLAPKFRDVAKEQQKVLVFATDYFRSMVQGQPISESDQKVLLNAMKFSPDFLVINETSYSIAWQKIARTAIELSA